MSGLMLRPSFKSPPCIFRIIEPLVQDTDRKCGIDVIVARRCKFRCHWVCGQELKLRKVEPVNVYLFARPAQQPEEQNPCRWCIAFKRLDE
jgi:hypothetical protein